MRESVDVVIYGAGGFAREVAWLVECCGSQWSPMRVVCFIDDNAPQSGTLLNGIPVLRLDAARSSFGSARMVGGIGDPATRQELMTKAEAAGFDFMTLLHPRVEVSRWIEVGIGSVVCAGSILTTNIRLGRHVQINLDCTIGHDVILGDYVTLAPGVHVSGWVHIDERAYIGTGATIINGTSDSPLSIGADAVVGAGACVTRSVERSTTVVGVPARPR